MDKRKTPRFKRRIPLRFWSEEDTTPRKGFTRNVSVTGMFIGTNAPFGSGTRITIEIAQRSRFLQLQGEVCYSARVDPALRKVRVSGMGVRLLKVEELMSELLRLKQSDDQEPAEANDGEPPVFAVYIDTPNDLVETYERDIKHGGMFVPTTEPVDHDQQVNIEFLFRWDPKSRISVEAQVVKKFPAEEDSVLGQIGAGMGVAFSNPPEALAKFRDVFSSLDAPPEVSSAAF